MDGPTTFVEKTCRTSSEMFYDRNFPLQRYTNFRIIKQKKIWASHTLKNPIEFTFVCLFLPPEHVSSLVQYLNLWVYQYIEGKDKRRSLYIIRSLILVLQLCHQSRTEGVNVLQDLLLEDHCKCPDYCPNHGPNSLPVRNWPTLVCRN